MKNEFWLDKWKLNDIGFHEQTVNADLMEFLPTLTLNAGDTVFVPLCGKSKDMVWLAEQGFQVIGAELSDIACHDFFAELNVTPDISKHDKYVKYQFRNITIYCGDIFALTTKELPTIDAVYDCKALIALPEEVRKQYVHHLLTTLGDQIKILLLTRESHSPVKPPPYPVTEEEVMQLYHGHHVVQLTCRVFDEIPPRLKERGYQDMKECVYLIRRLG